MTDTEDITDRIQAQVDYLNSGNYMDGGCLCDPSVGRECELCREINLLLAAKREIQRLREQVAAFRNPPPPPPQESLMSSINKSHEKEPEYAAPKSIVILDVIAEGVRRWTQFEGHATYYQINVGGWTLSYLVSSQGKWAGCIWKRGTSRKQWWALAGATLEELNADAKCRLQPIDYGCLGPLGPLSEPRTPKPDIEMHYQALDVRVQVVAATGYGSKVISGTAEQVASELRSRGYQVTLVSEACEMSDAAKSAHAILNPHLRGL